jgi:hypothetical protein
MNELKTRFVPKRVKTSASIQTNRGATSGE